MELAEKLTARGFAAEALNGDIAQAQRERTVERLRDGRLDILVATDVAARGLDVKRVTHVINFDIPYDTESYVHRIGRTGRAGAPGEAILFVAPRERRLLHSIEKATGGRIEPMAMPSVQDINSKRTERFKQQVRELIAKQDLAIYYRLVSELEQEDEIDALQIAAALARLAQGDVPLLLDAKPDKVGVTPRGDETGRSPGAERAARVHQTRPAKALQTEAMPLKDYPEIEMERFRLDVGYTHGVKPGNIVGAIANEAELESKYIGHIEIFDDFATVDLPAGMPKETLRDLQKTWVCQRKLAITRLRVDGPGAPASGPPRQRARPAKNTGAASARRKAGRPSTGVESKKATRKTGSVGKAPRRPAK
jgi:ATP-dependent RNA helicase DeaD